MDLLKYGVTGIRALVGTLNTVTAGGTVIDPDVVWRLFNRNCGPLERLTDRKRKTLALMAQGCSCTAITLEMFVSEVTVAEHIRNVFDKLDLAVADTDHRRVLAVLTCLQQYPHRRHRSA